MVRVSRRSKPALLRGAGQVAEVEADVLELEMRADEDERLPAGEPLEELLAVGELDERLDVRRREVAVQDLEQTERGSRSRPPTSATTAGTPGRG